MQNIELIDTTLCEILQMAQYIQADLDNNSGYHKQHLYNTECLDLVYSLAEKIIKKAEFAAALLEAKGYTGQIVIPDKQ